MPSSTSLITPLYSSCLTFSVSNFISCFLHLKLVGQINKSQRSASPPQAALHLLQQLPALGGPDLLLGQLGKLGVVPALAVDGNHVPLPVRQLHAAAHGGLLHPDHVLPGHLPA